MSTRAALRSLIERRMGEVYPITTGTLDSMPSLTTVVDADRDEAEGWWKNCHIYLEDDAGTNPPHGEERGIVGFVSSTGTFTVTPGFSATATAGFYYWLRRKASKRDYDDAINMAIKRAGDGFLEEKVDGTSIVVYGDQKKYQFPSDLRALFRLDLEQCEVVCHGTATGATPATLTDASKSWTPDQYKDYYAVVIVQNTGQGQQRTILGNTATELTVATWDTTPDASSRFLIKYIGQEKLRWVPYTAFDWNTSWADGVATRWVHFYGQLPEGMSVRIVYAAQPPELTADDDVSGLPDIYIELEGVASLHELLAGRIVGGQAKEHLTKATFFRAEAERYKRDHGYRPTWTRMRGAGGAPVKPADWPFG